MLPRHATVDDYESEVPTAPNADSDREPTVMRHMTPIPTPPRSSARALYVPSPLPMWELKKAMARADEEATLEPSPATALPADAPPSSAPTRLHGQREATPFELAKTSLAAVEDRRFSSNVDADEARANAGWRFPIPPLPALEEFAPIIGASHLMPQGAALPVPGVALARANAGSAVSKEGGSRSTTTIVILFALSLLVALVAIGFARGDLTRSHARDAAGAVERAVSHVAANVKRL